ncbi:MAG: hypothetical protein ACRDRS_10585 [Pseudonocardiaceae bacterium]
MPSDRSRDLFEPGTAGTDINPPPSLTRTKTVATVLTEELGYIRQGVRNLHEATDELHQQSLYTEWNARTNTRGRASAQEMLDEMADLGFAWRNVAKLVGVSVAAIQKWRRGEGATGENRQKVASLLAACDLVCENYGIQEVASWFEMPLQLGVPVTPVDLWACGRSDLVLDFASGHTDSEQILTDWDPQWRERYRSDFEVFRAADGQLSIRPKAR